MWCEPAVSWPFHPVRPTAAPSISRVAQGRALINAWLFFALAVAEALGALRGSGGGFGLVLAFFDAAFEAFVALGVFGLVGVGRGSGLDSGTGVAGVDAVSGRATASTGGSI